MHTYSKETYPQHSQLASRVAHPANGYVADADGEQMEVVFLDSGGVITRLLSPRPLVYLKACKDRGIDISPRVVEEAFERCEALLPSREDIFLGDYPSFRAEYSETFQEATGLGGRLEEVDKEFMRQLQSKDHRALHEDVLPTLQSLEESGIRLGIVSNASRELIPLLLHLGVVPFFEAIVVSDLVGSEKPQAEIFHKALETLDVEASQAVHVGDNYWYDYLGATRAGLESVLLDRSGASEGPAPTIGTLAELPRFLHL